MKRKLLLFPGLAVALLLGSAVEPWWHAHRLMRRSEPIQASLETYRQQHHHYPESLSQIGLAVREEGPLYYQRETESSYILWFGTTLGESRIFHSTDGRWQ